MKKYSEVLKDLLNALPLRSLAPRFTMFPQLIQYYIFPKEKELLHNINVLRENVRGVILDKK